jgi:hypothetical protein
MNNGVNKGIRPSNPRKNTETKEMCEVDIHNKNSIS